MFYYLKLMFVEIFFCGILANIGVSEAIINCGALCIYLVDTFEGVKSSTIGMKDGCRWFMCDWQNGILIGLRL